MKKLTGTLLFTGAMILGCFGGKDKPSGEEPSVAAPEPVGADLADKLANSVPLEPNPSQVEVGGWRLSPQLCTISGMDYLGVSTMDMFNSIVALGDRLVLADGKGQVQALHVVSTQPCELQPDPTFGSAGKLELEEEINWLSRDSLGRVMASNGIFDAYAIADGQLAFKCDTRGYVELHSSGDWGISTWVNSTTRLVEIKDQSCSSKEWVLKDLGDDEKRQGIFSNVNTTAFLGDTILVGGIVAKSIDPDEPRIVVAYDRGGRELFRFGDDDTISPDAVFGWIHALSPCKPGICALDSNYRRFSLWSERGRFLGSADLGDLLGLDYPWIADFDMSTDGGAYLLVAQDREGGEVAQGLIYRVEGLGETSPPVSSTSPAVSPAGQTTTTAPAARWKDRVYPKLQRQHASGVTGRKDPAQKRAESRRRKEEEERKK